MPMNLELSRPHYEKWLEEIVDTDLAGNPFRRREIRPAYTNDEIAFCAGFQSAQKIAEEKTKSF